MESSLSAEVQDERPIADQSISMPKPTYWPMTLAAGATLVAFGLPTSLAVSVAGLVILIISLGGWISELAPGAGEIEEPLEPPEKRAKPVVVSKRKVAEAGVGMPGHRMHLPEKVHPYSAGAIGGLYGGCVMAVVALLFGLISGRGLWYPINLLSAMILPEYHEATVETISQFSFVSLIVATLIHFTTSVLVGLFFGILLPTLPKSPRFWGGVVAPLLWSGAIYGFMHILNPVMNRYVDWPWFVASQFAYGLVVGNYVVKTEKVTAKRIEGGASPDWANQPQSETTGGDR